MQENTDQKNTEYGHFSRSEGNMFKKQISAQIENQIKRDKQIKKAFFEKWMWIFETLNSTFYT